MTLTLLPGMAMDFMIVFARIGALFMLLPAVGERAIPGRQRLALALLVTLMALPGIQPSLPPRGEFGRIIGLLVSEILIGLMIGVCSRMVLAAMETGGNIIAQTIGLSFAQSVDPSQGQQGEIMSSLMRMLGVMLIFSSDMHHVAIAGIFDSYVSVPPGTALMTGDAATLGVRLMGEAFVAAVRIAAPFLVFGFVFNAGIGLASRMVPQIQLFFLAMPVSIVLGLMALAIILGISGGLFQSFAGGVFAELFPGVR